MTNVAPPVNPGDLDNYFGNKGIQLIKHHNHGVFRCHGLNLSTDGKLLVAGSHAPVAELSHYSLQRCTANGQLDKTFGVNGYSDGQFTSDAALSSTALKTFTLENSRLLLFGMFNSSRGEPLPAFARLHTNGQLDTTFGDGGKFVSRSPLPTDGGSPINSYLGACIQSTKNIVSVHPHAWEDEVPYVILRITEDGQQDVHFNEDEAYVDISQPGGEKIYLTAIAVQTDDKFLVCGYSEDFRGIKTGIILRFEKDGKTDSTFAVRGVFRKQDWRFEHLVVLDYRILCCGSTTSGEALLVLLDHDGELLGEPSITPADISSRWTKMAYQDNKIVVTGETQGDFGSQFLVARFNNDTTLDQSFGVEGCVSINFGGINSKAVDLIVDANQGIVVLTSARQPVGDEQFFLARILS
ncbi:hypothetical protein KRR23_02010 [Pseudomonas sp. CVAP|uniref:hypothetical protein n=1 Tax=Pseudomonas sp. CVAP\|nr:hypothetical protein [Pseudomonas sp. CVAP\